mmetsp:Transcript_19632/g.63104  ORF Transcript_19632/g.63104 Transcript_19632/m.63104 type:complete len:216 (-) Transcript_19632:67-714(-)
MSARVLFFGFGFGFGVGFGVGFGSEKDVRGFEVAVAEGDVRRAEMGLDRPPKVVGLRSELGDRLAVEDSHRDVVLRPTKRGVDRPPEGAWTLVSSGREGVQPPQRRGDVSGDAFVLCERESPRRWYQGRQQGVLRPPHDDGSEARLAGGGVPEPPLPRRDAGGGGGAVNLRDVPRASDIDFVDFVAEALAQRTRHSRLLAPQASGAHHLRHRRRH